jgi:hypothetical protein
MGVDAGHWNRQSGKFTTSSTHDTDAHLMLLQPSPCMERRGRDSQSFVKVCLRVLGSYSDHVPNECLDKVPENALQLAAATTTSLLSSSEFRLVPFSLPWKQKNKNDYRSAIS